MSRRRAGARAVAVLGAVALSGGCRTGHNYLDPAGPRYAAAAPDAAERTSPDTLRVVAFNVEHAERIDSAIAVLTGEAALRDVDLVLLQEMDADGTRRVAEALGMGFVYYPATSYIETGRDFGNAVLSRWPFEDDAKLLLPHVAPFGRTRRTATAATLRVGEVRVRVYSVHLGTLVNVGPSAQRAQFEAILADAAGHDHVVIGGDMNTAAVGDVAVDRGYAWPTEDGPRTLFWGRFDHIFFRGLHPPRREASGTIEDNRGASDHLPVWAVGLLTPDVPGPSGR